MLSATKIRIYPNKEQRAKLSVQFGHARFVFNEALEACQKHYRETGKSLNYHALAVRLPGLKSEKEWLKEADSQVLQQTVQNLSGAFENFFAKRAAYPTFKSRHDKQSVSYPQRVKIDGKRLYLPKVGLLKCVVHREIVGRIKTVTVSMNKAGQYYAAVLTDDGIEMPAVSTQGKAIGIDVGIIDIAVTSDGSKFANPRALKKAETALKRRQKLLSRKTKGSKQRAKARLLVAKAHLKIANVRKDYVHKLSRKLVNENQVIVTEDLNVKGMLKNHKLAKAVSDASWGMLTGFLKYKAERAGKAFLKVDRFFPSSKTCSACLHVRDKMPLSLRVWTCEKCGIVHDRDICAAQNIRDEGLRILMAGAAIGGGTVSRKRKFASRSARPVETGSSAF